MLEYNYKQPANKDTLTSDIHVDVCVNADSNTSSVNNQLEANLRLGLLALQVIESEKLHNQAYPIYSSRALFVE